MKLPIRFKDPKTGLIWRAVVHNPAQGTYWCECEKVNIGQHVYTAKTVLKNEVKEEEKPWAKSPVDKPDEYRKIIFTGADNCPYIGHAVFSGRRCGFKDVQGEVIFDAASIIYWRYKNESS